MTYAIKELFYTVQGEGLNAGRPAIFCRFSGCNLWTGREMDRAKAVCQFCDTDFVGTDGEGGAMFESPQSLAHSARRLWPSNGGVRPLIVCTGGEPLLQLNGALIDAFRGEGFEVAIETNGTIPLPSPVDWTCVSPKARTKLALTEGNELKVVFPQDGLNPEEMESLNFEHFLLQPMDGPRVQENTQLAIDYCLRHPKWRLSIQVHKIVGVR